MRILIFTNSQADFFRDHVVFHGKPNAFIKVIKKPFDLIGHSNETTIVVERLYPISSGFSENDLKDIRQQIHLRGINILKF